MENLPRMHLGSPIDSPDAPESFTERLLQVRLAQFWRGFGQNIYSGYDSTVAEERYERFHSEFLGTLPSAFAIPSNKKWDGRFPALPLQRQLLHIKIFDSICWNFRPLLLIKPHHVRSLPPYKRVLLASQQNVLAVAALRVLDTVSSLHLMMGAGHTRWDGIIFHTFESAVVLACLCIDVNFPRESGDASPNGSMVDLWSDITPVSRETCLKEIRNALDRLEKLAEVSSMAEAGEKALALLWNKAVPITDTQPIDDLPCIQFPGSNIDLAQWPVFDTDSSGSSELLAASSSYSTFNSEIFSMLARA
jgi:hypothetical protein